MWLCLGVVYILLVHIVVCRNYVLAWLSSVGPVVHLEIPLEYAKLVADGYECIKTDS